MSSSSDRGRSQEPDWDEEPPRRTLRRRRRELEDEEDEPRPRRRREYEEDDDEEEDRPRLGKLAQQARGKQLKVARGILIAGGILTILLSAVDFALARSILEDQAQKEVNKRGPGFFFIDRTAVDRAVLVARVIDGGVIFLGLVFVALGAVVYRFPVPATVTALVLYILGTLVIIVLLVVGKPKDEILPGLGIGLVFRILFIIAFSKAIQAAIAYEKAMRRQARFD